jgi:hypothetical protein
LPIVYLSLTSDDLWRLTSVLDHAFASEPEIGVSREDWIAGVQDALTPDPDSGTAAAEGEAERPRSLRVVSAEADDAGAAYRPPPVMEAPFSRRAARVAVSAELPELGSRVREKAAAFGPAPASSVSRPVTVSRRASLQRRLFACVLLLLGGFGLAYSLDLGKFASLPFLASATVENTRGETASNPVNLPGQAAPNTSVPGNAADLGALRRRAEAAEEQMRRAQERAAASEARVAAVAAALAAERSRAAPSQPAPPLAQPAPAARPEPAPSGRRGVLAQAANLRDGPQNGSNVLRTLPRGTALRVFARAPGGWIQVGTEAPWGWVHGSLFDEQD